MHAGSPTGALYRHVKQWLKSWVGLQMINLKGVIQLTVIWRIRHIRCLLINAAYSFHRHQCLFCATREPFEWWSCLSVLIIMIMKHDQELCKVHYCRCMGYKQAEDLFLYSLLTFVFRVESYALNILYKTTRATTCFVVVKAFTSHCKNKLRVLPKANTQHDSSITPYAVSASSLPEKMMTCQ